MKICRSWLLLYAALIGIVGHVSALRATSLIFGKQLTTSTTSTSTSTSTYTTTTKTPTSISPTTEAPDSVIITEESSDSTNSSKPVLTGIPQIDYIWDPNLPRELNGYNLTNYPFLSGVPPTEAEVGFKCAELHDGFYASIKWKCQLYHHCIHGVRYDFLCANFTAFDQRTFICHFVSEVDCKNSAKYWFRNDALYVNPTTTTTTTTPSPVTQPSISATARPYGRPRRPLRRRPQIDYYEDDYVEEYDDPRPPPPRRTKQKPRNRRPDFDDYTVNSRGGTYADDEQYEARPAGNAERNRNRQDDSYDSYERPATRNRNRNKANRRKPQNNDYEERPLNDQEKRRKPNNERRKIVDDEEVERRPSANDRRKLNDDRRINYEEDTAPKRQYEDDYEERPIRKNNKPPLKEVVIEEVKPTSSGSSSGGVSSIFNNPRKPPKISRPVPINEKKKFEYTAPVKTAQSALDDSEYYDDYEEPPQPQRSRKPAANGGGQKITEPAVRPEETQNKRAVSNSRPGRIDPKPFKRPAALVQDEEYYEEEYEERNPPPSKKQPTATNEFESRNPPQSLKRPFSNFREKSTSPAPQISHLANRNRFKESEELVEPEKKLHVREKDSETPLRRPTASLSADSPLILKKDNYNVQSGEYTNRQQDNEKYVNVDREVSNNKNTNINSRQQQKSPIRTPYDEPMSRDDEEREVRPIVRVVKRPFLPSRGGSPYLPRGLQPVGNNARPFESSTSKNIGEFSIKVDSKENLRNYDDEPHPQEQSEIGAKKKITLDEIYDSEYDVTLNDALNPTLKPLTSKNRYQSTSYSELAFAPTHIRRSHLNPPITLASTSSRKQPRIPITRQDSYEDDYDY